MSPTSPKLRRSYIDAPTGQVHYYDSLGGGVPLLLLHQAPASSLDYQTLFPFFIAAGVRIIAMDTPGLGLSDAPEWEPTIADYAAAVPMVLDHAGVTQADAMGYHTGAQITVEAAVRYPGRIRRIVLYGVPVMTAEEREGWWNQIVPREKEGAIHKPTSGGVHLQEQYARLESFVGPVAAQRLLLASLTAGPTWWMAHNAALTHDMVPALKAVTQPILLVDNPGEMLSANTQAAKAIRPDATLVTVDVECPILFDGDPAGLVDTVVEFLRAAQNSP